MFSSKHMPVFNLPPNSFHSNSYYAYKAAKDSSKSCRFTSYAELEEEANRDQIRESEPKSMIDLPESMREMK